MDFQKTRKVGRNNVTESHPPFVSFNERGKWSKKPDSNGDSQCIKTPVLITEICEDFVVFDVETTGLDYRKDRIVEVSALKFEKWKLINRFEALIDPEVEISDEVTRINGITNQMLWGKPKIDVVLPKLLEYIGKLPIVAHNAMFDARFLKFASFRVFGHDVVDNFFIDTLDLSRKIYPNLVNYKLTTIKNHICMDVVSHRAYGDTLVTAKIYFEYCRKMKKNEL